MTRVGIVAKPDAAGAADALTRLVAWLGGRGLPVVLEKETAGLIPVASVPSIRKSDLAGQVDLLVVLGGDGTLLSMARAVGDLGVPILGVNLGDLGFLTATTLDEMLPAVETALAGRMAIDERMLLSARHVRAGASVGQHTALNDVVITKSAMSRIINLKVSVEGGHATAYCLSAGGPILFPTMDAVVLVPIASHTLTNRPIVLPATQRIEVTLLTDQEVMLTVDGQVGVPLRQHDVVEIEKAPGRVRLLRFPRTDFFSVLRTKLKWGER